MDNTQNPNSIIFIIELQFYLKKTREYDTFGGIKPKVSRHLIHAFCVYMKINVYIH
jgi:hypothetical protein